MARDIALEVERLLQFRDPNIRKKDHKESSRLGRKFYQSCYYALLREKHHMVLSTGVQLCTSLCKISTEALEHIRKYWRCQLPDDITPDFKVMGEDESQCLNNISLASLSLYDDNESSIFPYSKGSRYILNEKQELSQHNLIGN
ncbi:hypothetical protein Fmac_015760 [Flemingia macrophylla]|uniref:Uncharacterized protein n=1 Tax=Flemingia macrophylla TaxID=520843 RepID=A0ABD1MG44_9FABA